MVFITLAGFLVILLPLLPLWGAIKGVGGEGRGDVHFLRVVVGFLLLYVAAMIRERQRLKSGLMDLVDSFDSFNAALYGKNYKVTRETVTYLITSLGSSSVSVRERALGILVKLTGQDLGSDREAWRKWWERNKHAFKLPERVADEQAGPGPGKEERLET